MNLFKIFNLRKRNCKQPTLTEIATKHWEYCEKEGEHNRTQLEHAALINSEVGRIAFYYATGAPQVKIKAVLADIILRVLDLALEENIDIEQVLIRRQKYLAGTLHTKEL